MVAHFKNIRLSINTWVIAALFLVIILITPVLVILYNVFDTPSETWTHLYQTVFGDYIANTLIVAIGVAFLTLLIGIATAWLVATCNFPGRSIFEWMLILPLSVPTYIVAYTYAGIFDYTGPIQKFMRDVLDIQESGLLDIMNIYGIIGLLSFVLYPYVYVMVKTTFLNQSQLLLESSRILGSSATRTFFKVAFPLARPAIIGGVSLVLMETLNDYGAMSYFGINTFTTGIFRAWFSLGDVGAAIYLSGFLMLFVFLLILVERWQRGRASYSERVKLNKPIRKYKLNRLQSIFAFIVCLLPVLIGFIIPFAQLLYWASQTSPHVINRQFWLLVLNSFTLAMITACLCIVIATILLYAARLHPTLFVKTLTKVTVLGYSIPGAVIAIGIMVTTLCLDSSLKLFLKNTMGLSVNLLLSGSFIILIFAYLVRFLAISYNAIETGFKEVSINLHEVARSLGTGTFKTLWQVELPLIKNALIAGILLVFIDVLKELPLTLVLRPFNFETLATKTFQLASDERVADSASIALIIIITETLPIFFLSKLITNKMVNESSRNS